MDQKRIIKIIEVLKKVYDVSDYSNRGDAFEVLVGTVLSQRTKDEVTWPRNKELMKKANTPEKMLKLSEKEIAKIIYPVGFYNQKAKKIKELSKILLDNYKGKIPRSREELMKLPMVGDKTSSCVLSYAFNEPTIAVDTHVNRISQKLGIVPKKSKPENTRKILEEFVPDKLKSIINALFIEHGKNICKALNPKCNLCSVKKYCEFYNLK